MSTQDPTPARKRDAAATRQDILDAARAQFSRAPYDQVGLRDIATQAGIDVALIARYFGSKEALFAAVLEATAPPAPQFPADRNVFGEWLVRRLLTQGDERDPTRFLILHHSVTSPGAAAMIRASIRERLLQPMAQWLGGPDAELRAALIVSHMAGIGLMRHILGIEALAQADRQRLVARMAPVVQAYVDLGSDHEKS